MKYFNIFIIQLKKNVLPTLLKALYIMLISLQINFNWGISYLSIFFIILTLLYNYICIFQASYFAILHVLNHINVWMSSIFCKVSFFLFSQHDSWGVYLWLCFMLTPSSLLTHFHCCAILGSVTTSQYSELYRTFIGPFQFLP